MVIPFVGGFLAIPPAQAVPAEPGQVHQVDVLHVGAFAQMLDQPAERRGLQFGSGCGVEFGCGHGCLLCRLPPKMARLARLRHTARAGKERKPSMPQETLAPMAMERHDPPAPRCAPCSTPPSRPPTRARCWPATCRRSRHPAAASSSAAANPPPSWPPRWRTPGRTSRWKALSSPATATPCPTRRIEVIEASHPVPDDNSERGAKRLLERVQGLTKDDLVIALMSGGASALLAAPVAGPDAGGQAGDQSRPAGLRRQHHRDERRPEASVGDQGRPPRRRRGAGPGRDPGDQRRPRRRPGRHRLRPDGPRRHDLRRGPRADRPLRHHAAAGGRRPPGAG